MRVSTREQTVAGQLDALRRVELSRIFEETASGANRDRPPPDHHAPGPIQALGQDLASHRRHSGRRDRGLGRGSEPPQRGHLHGTEEPATEQCPELQNAINSNNGLSRRRYSAVRCCEGLHNKSNKRPKIGTATPR